MKRILSVFSLLCGSGIIAYSVYLIALRQFLGKSLTGNIIFLAVGILLLAVGFAGNLFKRNRSLTDDQRTKLKKRYKSAAIVAGVLFVGVAFYIVLFVVLQMSDTNRVDASLRTMMQDEYTQIGVPLPDNAKYILYNINKQEFKSDSRTILKGISGNPKLVNVVVTYQIDTVYIGTWKTVSGATIADAYEESMKLSVVRLSDWSLIEEKTFVAVRSDNNLGKGDKKYTYQVSLYDSEISSYLNGLFN